MLGVRDVRESPMPRVVLEHRVRQVPDYTICLLHLLVVTLSLLSSKICTRKGREREERKEAVCSSPGAQRAAGG